MFDKKPYNPESEELIKAIDELKTGSAQAFHVLYSAYNQKVYRFCYRMLGDEATAKDAFQETFIKIFEHRKEFKGTNFQAWLFTIGRHTCLNYIRTKKVHDTFIEDYHSSLSAADSDIGMQEFIQKAIAKLPVSLKEALLLREYEECTYYDIADILGIEVSLAKVRVHRARMIMRKLLKPLVKEIYES